MNRRLIRNINTIARCSTLYRDRQLAGSGLNGYQAPYLPEICANPGLSQDELAQRLHVNRSSVTRQLALLEEAGFILRQRSESDRRTICVYPTERMVQTLPEVRRVFGCWRDLLIQGIDEEELDALATLLKRLACRAEEIENNENNF